MADTATAPATEAKTKNVVVKPDKPDDEAFKKDAAELEKAHKTKQEQLVSESQYNIYSQC
jgi:hypothetical protein